MPDIILNYEKIEDVPDEKTRSHCKLNDDGKVVWNPDVIYNTVGKLRSENSDKEKQLSEALNKINTMQTQTIEKPEAKEDKQEEKQDLDIANHPFFKQQAEQLKALQDEVNTRKENELKLHKQNILTEIESRCELHKDSIKIFASDLGFDENGNVFVKDATGNQALDPFTAQPVNVEDFIKSKRKEKPHLFKNEPSGVGFGSGANAILNRKLSEADRKKNLQNYNESLSKGDVKNALLMQASGKI